MEREAAKGGEGYGRKQTRNRDLPRRRLLSSSMSALKRLLPVVIPPTGKHTASLIFARTPSVAPAQLTGTYRPPLSADGFGATSSDWALLAQLPALRPYFKPSCAP